MHRDIPYLPTGPRLRFAPQIHRPFDAVIHRFSTACPPGYLQVMSVIARSESDEAIQFCAAKKSMDCFAALAMTNVAASTVHSPKQRPMIPQNYPRGVVAGGAGDAAAGMGAAAAMVQAF